MSMSNDVTYSYSQGVYAPQVYGVPTYDKLLKFILDDPDIRPSFLSAFIPGVNIINSTRLDESMNPVGEFGTLRNFIHGEDTQATVAALKDSAGFEVIMKGNDQSNYTTYVRGTKFLTGMITHYGEMKLAFPSENYDGRMDFVCKLNNEEFALVEVQVSPQEFWDRRASTYLASLFGSRIRRGGSWVDVNRVIGINILGGGAKPVHPWKDAPDEFLRHYRFQEQIHPKRRYFDGIELYQYALAGRVGKNITNEQRDWIAFLEESFPKTVIVKKTVEDMK